MFKVELRFKNPLSAGLKPFPLHCSNVWHIVGVAAFFFKAESRCLVCELSKLTRLTAAFSLPPNNSFLDCLFEFRWYIDESLAASSKYFVSLRGFGFRAGVVIYFA